MLLQNFPTFPKSFRVSFVAALVLVWTGTAQATPMTIVSSPQNTVQPFAHNVFHNAGSNGGQGGNIRAWFDLDASLGAANFYDPTTGALEAGFLLFEDAAFTNQIGTVSAIGTGLLGTTLGDGVENDVVVGTVDFTITLTSADGGFLAYLENRFGPSPTDTFTITMSFSDVLYVTSADGRTPNSFDGTDLSLWGSDGTYIGSSLLGGDGGRGGFGDTADLGVDFVVTVPTPGIALLLLPGLLAGFAAGRRAARD